MDRPVCAAPGCGAPATAYASVMAATGETIESEGDVGPVYAEVASGPVCDLHGADLDALGPIARSIGFHVDLNPIEAS